MIQLTSYDEVRSHQNKWLRHRAATNCFLSEAELKLELDEGALYMHEWEYGTAFLRCRGEHYIANIYALDGKIELPQLPIVTEIASGGRNSSDILTSSLERLGYSTEKTRECLVCKAPVGEIKQKVEPALPDDIFEVNGLLHNSFDQIYGCLPTPKRLAHEIGAGEVYVIHLDGRVAAALRATRTEIRQLSAHPDFRGMGLASSLVRAAASGADKKGIRVWRMSGNASAERLYASCGFTPNGYTSRVLLSPEARRLREKVITNTH